MVTSRILLFLGWVTLCWAEQSATWNWTCDAVKAQEGVDIDKVVGLWYFVEGIVNGSQKTDRNCNVLEILATDSNSSLLFQYHVLDQERTENINVTLISPSQWIEDGHAEVVVDLPPDGSTLAVTRCNHARGEQRTMVYGRNSTAAVDLVHARLQKSGVQGLQEATPYNRTGCPAFNVTLAGSLVQKPGSAPQLRASEMFPLILLLATILAL